jgi:hypothetical protein
MATNTSINKISVNANVTYEPNKLAKKLGAAAFAVVALKTAFFDEFNLTAFIALLLI